MGIPCRFQLFSDPKFQILPPVVIVDAQTSNRGCSQSLLYFIGLMSQIERG